MEQGNVVFKKLEGEFRHLDVAMRYIGIVRDQRFKNISTASATVVSAPASSPDEEDPLLPANRMQINQKEVAIVSQYLTPKLLENYFKMLVANKTPALWYWH